MMINMRSHNPLSFSFYFPSLTLSFLILFFSSSIFSITITTQTLIQQTCQKCYETDPNLSYDFCATSLESSPDSQRYSSDLRHLGLLAIRLTKQNVTSTRRFVKRLIKNDVNNNNNNNNNNNSHNNSTTKKKKLDPYVRACLSDCMELYGDAIQTIKAAVKDYKGKRYDDANIALSSVSDASTTCEDGFNDKVGVVSPLTKRNGDVFQLSAVSLSIINMLNNVG